MADVVKPITQPVNGDWTPVIKYAAALMDVKLDQNAIDVVLRRIQRESGGNQTIRQQVWDQNMASGNPAQGLLQYVPSTFRVWAIPGYANILSGFHQLLALFNDSNWYNDINRGDGWGPTGHRRRGTLSPIKVAKPKNKWQWPFPSAGEGVFDSTQLFGINPGGEFRKNGFHDGLDFGTSYHPGSQVHAVHGGKIVNKAYASGGIGWYVVTYDKDDGYYIEYQEAFSNASKIIVNVGDEVKTGQIIGYRDTDHLHLGITKSPLPGAFSHAFNNDGTWLDPRIIIKNGIDQNNNTDGGEYLEPGDEGYQPLPIPDYNYEAYNHVSISDEYTYQSAQGDTSHVSIPDDTPTVIDTSTEEQLKLELKHYEWNDQVWDAYTDWKKEGKFDDYEIITTTDSGFLSQDINLEAGLYTVSVLAKANDKNATGIVIDIANKNGDMLTTGVSNDYEVSSEWQQYSLTYELEKAGKIELSLGRGSNYTGKVYFANSVIYEGTYIPKISNVSRITDAKIKFGIVQSAGIQDVDGQNFILPNTPPDFFGQVLSEKGSKNEILPVVIDKNFNRLAVIDNYISFIWTERYYDVGDFEVVVNCSMEKIGLLKRGNYIAREDSNYTGIIEKIEIQTDADGKDLLIISGRFLSSILERRIIDRQTTVSGTLSSNLFKLIDKTIINPDIPERKINNFMVSGVSIGSQYEAQYTGKNLLDTISDVCKTNRIGFKTTLTSDKQFKFDLYEGVDRSYNQISNPYVVFSTNYENLNQSNYVENSKGLVTDVLVAGEGEGQNRKTAWARKEQKKGLDRYEVYKDSRNSSTNNGAISDEDYRKQLTADGLEYITDFSKAFTAEVDFSGYSYRVNLGLGDIVTVQDEEHGIFSNAQIVEVTESISETGEYKVNATFA